MYKGGLRVKGDNSWESWWDEEQAYIQRLIGRILETTLSLRFFIFQYGVVYKLLLTGKATSFSLYGFSWVALVGIVMIFKLKKVKLQTILEVHSRSCSNQPYCRPLPCHLYKVHNRQLIVKCQYMFYI